MIKNNRVLSIIWRPRETVEAGSFKVEISDLAGVELTPQKNISNQEATTSSPQFVSSEEYVVNPESIATTTGVASTAAIAISTVAVLAQSAAQGISFAYLAKLILFLEFMSYFALISSPHTNFLKSLFENMFSIIHLDLIPNINEYLFEVRDSSEAYGFTKSRARALEVGAFLP